jgi:hypothetical protein
MTTPRALGALVVLGLSLSACGTGLSLDSGAHPAAVSYVPAGAAALPSGGPTTRIASEGFVDVEVTVGAASSVNISCAPALLPSIHVESRGDLLRIWTDSTLHLLHTGRCVAFVGSPHLVSFEVSGSGDGRVHGHANELERVDASGSGDIEIDELTAPSVHLTANGSGDVTARGLQAHTLAIAAQGSGDVRVAGTSDSVSVDCSGSGAVDARGLGAATVEAHANGSGDVEIAASQRADVDANGSGDIVVRGRPAQRSVNRNGSGSISFE